MRENWCKVPIGKGRIGTNEGKSVQSAYGKKKSRHDCGSNDGIL